MPIGLLNQYTKIESKTSSSFSVYNPFGVDRRIFFILSKSKKLGKVEVLETVYGTECQQSEQTCMQNLA